MNMILFMPDQLRADTLACYGNGITATPGFDRLAAEGVRFDQCHVQNPVCSPSRCSLFTGRYVHVDGHRSLWSLLKPYEHNLAGYLKRDGYQVRVYGKNDLFSQEAIGEHTSRFTNIQPLPGKTPDNTHQPDEPGFYDFVYEPLACAPGQSKDQLNLTAALEFLRGYKPSDKPFFLFLPMELPHCPYTIMEPYYSMYDPDTLPPLLGHGTGKPAFHQLIREYRNMEAEPQKDLRRLRAIYYGMVSYTDYLLRQLLDCLDETGLTADTLLAVTSDHGDYAGDYGLPEKWTNGMEDALTHVPLLVRGPGCVAGHTVAEQVELFDVMPTLLEAAGIKPSHAFNAQSLWPALRGGSGDPERIVYCEGGYNPDEWPCNESMDEAGRELLALPQNHYYPKILQQKQRPESACRTVMARTIADKLILRVDGDHEYYQLDNDPGELINRYHDPACSMRVAELEKKILSWYLKSADCVPHEKDPRGVVSAQI